MEKRKVFNDSILDGIIYYIASNVVSIVVVLAICISFSISSFVSYWLFIDLKAGGSDYAVPVIMVGVLGGFLFLLLFSFINVELDALDNIKWLCKTKYEKYEKSI